MITFAHDQSSYDATTITGKLAPTDWVKIRDVDHESIAIIKSSEYGTDPAFKMNWNAARGILPRMAYHYFRPGDKNQWNVLQTAIGDDFLDNDLIALDWESLYLLMTKKSQLDAGYSILSAIRHEYDTTPYICTYPEFWNNIIGGKNDPRFVEFKLWEMVWPYDVKPYITSTHPVFTALEMVNFKAQIMVGKLSVKSIGGTNPSRYILAPWNREPDMWQLTSRCSPAYIKGYPVGSVKKAVDYNAVYMDVSH